MHNDFRDIDYSDDFNINFIQLHIYLNLYINKIDIDLNRFKEIITLLCSSQNQYEVLSPYFPSSLSDLYESLDNFILDELKIKNIPLKIDNLILATFYITLLKKIDKIKKYFNKKKNDDFLQIKMKIAHIVNNISKVDIIIPDNYFINELSISKIFNQDIIINFVHNSQIIDYQKIISYIAKNINSIFNLFSEIAQKNIVDIRFDYNNFEIYNKNLISLVNDILENSIKKNDFNIVIFFILKLFNHIEIIVSNINR